MLGPYNLDNETIDNQITKKSAGNYGLGYVDDKGVFIVKYVGRSDEDLNSRLKKHVGNYKMFKYCYATSPKVAFEKECNNYHDFGEAKDLDNEIHPDRPEGSDWKCPSCKNFG